MKKITCRVLTDTCGRESLNKALEIFKECSADGCVEKYGKELAELS
jgi:hypothetical protein